MRAPFIVLFAAFLAVPAQQPAPRERASAAVRDLGLVLQQMLGEELKRGGFEGAVKSCADSAQLVTEEFGKERELDIRRVSLKYRNQKDQPDEWEAARLKDWEARLKTGQPPAEHFATVTENGKQFARFMKPILVQGMCLSCHGERDKISPEVLEVLNARYPRDKATGHKAGDLRGAFSVMVELKP